MQQSKSQKRPGANSRINCPPKHGIAKKKKAANGVKSIKRSFQDKPKQEGQLIAYVNGVDTPGNPGCISSSVNDFAATHNKSLPQNSAISSSNTGQQKATSNMRGNDRIRNPDPWSDQEDEQILRLYFEMMDAPAVAEVVQRTKTKVQQRLRHLVSMNSLIYQKILQGSMRKIP